MPQMMPQGCCKIERRRERMVAYGVRSHYIGEAGLPGA
jgi:hypothetical protein